MKCKIFGDEDKETCVFNDDGGFGKQYYKEDDPIKKAKRECGNSRSILDKPKVLSRVYNGEFSEKT